LKSFPKGPEHIRPLADTTHFPWHENCNTEHFFSAFIT
jgi:hypothetical protein